MLVQKQELKPFALEVAGNIASQAILTLAAVWIIVSFSSKRVFRTGKSLGFRQLKRKQLC